jgi:hypothetical protein
VEVRPVFEAADFGDEFTPELRDREARIEQQLRSPAEPDA